MHVGVVHLLVNMVAQMLVGAQIEREMGKLEPVTSICGIASSSSSRNRQDRLEHAWLFEGRLTTKVRSLSS